MDKVQFKRGLYSKLPLQGNATEGSFYLTTDTDKLYIGKVVNGSTIAVPLNQGINFISSTAALPTLSTEADANKKYEDQFYFCQAENILAIYSNGGWVQTNPDTNDNDVSSITSNSITVSSIDNGVNVQSKIDTQIVNKSGIVISTDSKSSDFKIVGGDNVTVNSKTQKINNVDTTVIEINGEVAIAPDITVTDGVASIDIGGKGDGSSTFTIEGGDNINVTSTNGGIKLDIDIPELPDIPTYSTSLTQTTASTVGVAEINLIKNENNEAATVSTIKIGTTDNSIVVGSNEEQITINHKQYSYSNPTTITTSTEPLAPKAAVTVVTGATVENGHITALNTGSFVLPEQYSIKDITINSDGNIVITEKDSSGNVQTTTTCQTSIYTKDEVDSIIGGLDGMTFKGAVDYRLPVANVSNGDTYIVNEDGIYAQQSAEIGDLFIATGEEGENGYIDEITWVHVPSGNSVYSNTQYTLRANNNSIKFRISGAATDQNIINLSGDDYITATATSGTNSDMISITHKTVTSTSSTKKDFDGTLSYMSGITLDGAGHVTAHETTTADIVDLVQGNQISINENDNGELVIAHEDISNIETYDIGSITETTTVQSNVFSIPTEFNMSNGHVVGIKTTKIEINSSKNISSTKTAFANVTVGNAKGKKQTFNLISTDNSVIGSTLTQGIVSESLAVGETSEDGIVSLELNWGEF